MLSLQSYLFSSPFPIMLSVFFFPSTMQSTLMALTSEDIVLKQALKLLGRCVRLEKSASYLWELCETLFFLKTSIEDQGLTDMLMADMGKLVYPTYEIVVDTAIFSNRVRKAFFSPPLARSGRASTLTKRTPFSFFLFSFFFFYLC